MRRTWSTPPAAASRAGIAYTGCPAVGTPTRSDSAQAGGGVAIPGSFNVKIPTNQPVPAEGDLVEVAYLYAFPGGSLFQPVLLGQRSDLGAEDCTMGQLKFKRQAEAA